MKVFFSSLMIAGFALLSGCQSVSGFSVLGNEGGSQPISEQEAYDMQKAVNRCHRSGGTRVVKIRGDLRCY